jgi:hypothetical protein
MVKKARTTRKAPRAPVNGAGDDRATLAALRRHARLLREISRQTKRVERMRERAKSDLLDFGIRLANQAGWQVTKTDPPATADRAV